MATLTGILFPSNKVQDDGFLSPSVEGDGGAGNNVATPQLVAGAGRVATGARAVNLPTTVGPARTLAGHATRAFSDEWFERVHILPSRIDVGNLVAQQTRAVEVWNAYRSAARTLSGVAGFDVDGVSISPAAAATFAPLESRTYNVELSLTGAPSFDGRFVFTFDTGARELPVTGQRVVAWPFAHNWASPVNEGFAYLTDVITAKRGNEQRRRIRGHARRTIEFDFTIAGSTDAREQARAFRRLNALLFGWQHRTFALPVWQDVSFLDDAAAEGANVVACETFGRDFDDDGLLIVWRSASDYEIAEIDAVADGAITLKRGLNSSYEAGVTIAPARLATMPESLQVEEITATVGQLRVVFALSAAERSTRRAVAFERETYRGADVFTRKNSAAEQTPQVEHTRARDAVDYDTGVFRHYARESAARSATEFRAVLNGRAEVADFLAWLETRAGRLSGVWCPTWQFDFEMIEDVAATSMTMRVDAFGYAQMYAVASNRRDVMIELIGGSRLFRRITGATDNGDGTETITLDAQFGESIAVDDVERISFLAYRRLDQDLVTLAFATDAHAAAAFRLRDLVETP